MSFVMADFYKRFVDEELDSEGRLKSFKLDLPENFNFSYDVIDDIRKLGVYVLSFKKIGAVYEISAIKQNDTKDKIVNGLNPTICEELPISPTDLIALEMEYSRRKEFINE